MNATWNAIRFVKEAAQLCGVPGRRMQRLLVKISFSQLPCACIFLAGCILVVLSVWHLQIYYVIDAVGLRCLLVGYFEVYYDYKWNRREAFTYFIYNVEEHVVIWYFYVDTLWARWSVCGACSLCMFLALCLVLDYVFIRSISPITRRNPAGGSVIRLYYNFIWRKVLYMIIYESLNRLR